MFACSGRTVRKATFNQAVILVISDWALFKKNGRHKHTQWKLYVTSYYDDDRKRACIKFALDSKLTIKRSLSDKNSRSRFSQRATREAGFRARGPEEHSFAPQESNKPFCRKKTFRAHCEDERPKFAATVFNILQPPISVQVSLWSKTA